jgi:nuclear transport factor 2 (NTF2) superfamily protein
VKQEATGVPHARRRLNLQPSGWRSRQGNELWEFDEEGLMRSPRGERIDGVPIDESERLFFGPRPEEERGQSFPLR